MSDGPRRRGDSEETARRVLEAAAAEFTERGDLAVVADIARRAGVTPGAVYPRWPHKSDLMADALAYRLEQFLPAQRVKSLGLTEMSPKQAFAAWGARLLRTDEAREVLVQVFGSARNNEAVREPLRSFLDSQADELAELVDTAKEIGLCDPEHDTTALVMMIQAIAIGTHLMQAGGLADRHVPSEQNWTILLMKLLGAMGPQSPQSE